MQDLNKCITTSKVVFAIFILFTILTVTIARQSTPPLRAENTNQANPPGKLSTTPITDKYEYSIKKGQDYLANHFSEITPNKRLILDYLQRKYGLYQQFSAAHTPINPPESGSTESPISFWVFRRIAYPNSFVAVLPDVGDDPMSQMMMQALYCDRMPLPLGFEQLVRSNIVAGGYNLTHVEFSLQRIKENGCQFLPPQQLSDLSAEVAISISRLATQQTTIPDLRYEAIAFLLDMNRQDLVQPEWLDRIIAEQQPSGVWKTRIDQVGSLDNDHSTILALWALLEYSRPNAPNEPMLHRPR